MHKPSERVWPRLDFSEWRDTCDTLHMWTQIVGKTRMALSPAVNHWWHVPLYVTPRGLTTSSIPFQDRTFDLEFDFIAHRLLLRTSEGAEQSIRLFPRSVANFYSEYLERLREAGITVNIHTKPDEFPNPIPFDKDETHASYDKDSVERFRRLLVAAERVLQRFRSRYVGKCSPVHFFWGSFDLAVTRFCGRRAPIREGADSITREAYSHEVSSCGFWPGDARFPHAAFYAYSSPAPSGLDKAAVQPSAAFWSTELGEFLLRYDDVRAAETPDSAILDFCQSTYGAGANLAGWDRHNLEREECAEITA
jgi:hypothetical protein